MTSSYWLRGRGRGRHRNRDRSLVSSFSLIPANWKPAPAPNAGGVEAGSPGLARTRLPGGNRVKMNPHPEGGAKHPCLCNPSRIGLQALSFPGVSLRDPVLATGFNASGVPDWEFPRGWSLGTRNCVLPSARARVVPLLRAFRPIGLVLAPSEAPEALPREASSARVRVSSTTFRLPRDSGLGDARSGCMFGGCISPSSD